MADLEDLGLIYGEAGVLASPRNLDMYQVAEVANPSVDAKWFGSFSGGTAGTNNALTLLNAVTDYPRNAFYSIPGVASGTFGGTFTCNWIDQFGVAVQEKVIVASAAPAVGIYGTAIVAKFISGTFASQGSSGGSIGTASIGFGTASNGSAQSNWFGFMAKLGGTADVKVLRWVNNGTPTTLNKGTSFGTLVSATNHAFQGTSGVAVTDQLFAIFKPTFDARSKGKVAAL